MKQLLKILLFFLLLFGVVYCSSPERKQEIVSKASSYLAESEKDFYDSNKRIMFIDSAFAELLAEKQNDSVTRFLYRKVMAGYYNRSAYDKALAVSDRMYEIAKSERDTLEMADVLFRKGQTYYQAGNNDTAFIFYDQAEKLYEEINSDQNKGDLLLSKAHIYYYIGEYVLCESLAARALAILKEQERVPSTLYSCNNLIAIALEGQNKIDDAIIYYNNALKQLDRFPEEGYEQSIIEYYRASAYNNLGGAYEKEGSYKRAISLYNEALKFEKLKEDYESLYAKLLNNLAYAKFKSGDMSGLPSMFYKSLEIREKLDLQSGVVASNIHLGEYFAFKKDTATALRYLKTAYEGAKNQRSHSDILESLRLLAALDKQNGMFYSSRRYTVSDSLDRSARDVREKYARIEYETNELADQNEALVKKNSFIIGISAVILLFIAAIFIIYYLNSKNKELLLVQEQQKANEEVYELMEEQQFKIDNARRDEKDRIAMELHDGILNNIYAVRLNLEFINRKTDDESIVKRKEFIKELQSVETEIRAVSHDLSRNAMLQQEKSFENILEYMITSQRNDFDTLFEAEIDSEIDWDSLSSIKKVNVYRIVQEALQNINKYSNAGFAKVDITREADKIMIVVADDGVGFDVNAAKGGIGIKNLRKRAAVLNGSFEIDSKPREGVTLRVSFPV